VTTPTDPLVTPTELSQWTGGKILTADPRSTALIAGATAAIRRLCGWYVAPSIEATFTLDGPGGDLIVLPTLHLTAVTSVTQLGVALTEYDQATHEGDYEWSANGEIRLASRPMPSVEPWRRQWTERYRAITVEATHGYAIADVPDVAQIIMQVCASAMSSPMGATTERAGLLSVTWATTAPGVAGGLALLERDLAILNLYRLPKGA